MFLYTEAVAKDLTPEKSTNLTYPRYEKIVPYFRKLESFKEYKWGENQYMNYLFTK